MTDFEPTSPEDEVILAEGKKTWAIGRIEVLTGRKSRLAQQLIEVEAELASLAPAPEAPKKPAPAKRLSAVKDKK